MAGKGLGEITLQHKALVTKARGPEFGHLQNPHAVVSFIFAVIKYSDGSSFEDKDVSHSS